MKTQNFISKLRLPIIQSPMFIVSNARLVIASSKAGIVGSFEGSKARQVLVTDLVALNQLLDQEITD